MGAIARVLQTQNGDDNEIIQTVEAHYNDSKYCEQFAPSGDDSPPLPEDRVFISEVEGTGNAISAGVMSKSQGAKPGEKILYARDGNGEVKAKIHLKNDGSILVEGEKDAELQIKGNISITVDGNCDLNASQVTITANTKITGGNCEIGGTVSPTGQGAFCGIPFCAFTGAPQCGNISQGT